MPTVTDLIHALPDESDAIAPPPLESFALRPVPVGRWRRLGALGTLQAKIAGAYLFHWIRGWFTKADERERHLAETHWRVALRLLDSMGYLRGAIMKVGQTLANYPDIAPRAFVETLDALHYAAPPMHWSLLREMVCNELGDEPDRLFARFETRAFAAASVGQVHRARLHTGEELAVKIQYPGIARAIREDFRNLNLFLLAGRVNPDWEYVRSQMEELRLRLEEETDYEREAAYLAKARSLFRESDGIVVPRVYPQHSTARVLTMERLEGVHLDQFLAGNPSQEARDEAARKILRAWFRLFAAGRLFYADFHPGNFLFMRDGRLGLIDFGFVLPLEGELWPLIGRMDRAMTTGKREDLLAANREWAWITDDPQDRDRLELTLEYTEWVGRYRWTSPFDFGDEADFRRGVELFTQMVRKRYSRARSWTPVIARQQFGCRALLYRLKAKIDVRPICEEELRATDWPRSEYA